MRTPEKERAKLMQQSGSIKVQIQTTNTLYISTLKLTDIPHEAQTCNEQQTVLPFCNNILSTLYFN